MAKTETATANGGVALEELPLLDRIIVQGRMARDDMQRDYARDLARNCSPRAMAVITGQVLDAADSTFDEALRRSFEHMDDFIGSADMREGVRSFLEGRAARFAPLDAVAADGGP